MENNGFDYEETFQSESQEEIDKEKKMSDQNYIDVYNSILKLNNNGRE